MRLRRLELLRYGHFSDRVVDLPVREPDLHLIVGPNESGKSTARAALSDLLFGFAAKTRWAFLHEQRALRVGAEIEHVGETVSLRRRKGNKDTLLGPDERPIGDARLAPMLGGADRAYFERMFSLDQPALAEGASAMLDAKGDLGRMLFQASAGSSAFGEALAALEEEAKALWAPRKAKDRAYYRAEEEMEAADRTIAESQVRARQWQQARADLEAATSALERAKQEHLERERERAALARVQRVAPALDDLVRLRGELEHLAGTHRLPEDARRTWHEATTAIALAEQRLRSLTEELAAAVSERDHIAVDEEILARADAVSALVGRQAQVSAYPADIAKRTAELRAREAEAMREAASLGWRYGCAEEIAARMPSKLVVARIDGVRETWPQAKTRVEAAEEALGKASARREDLLHEIEAISAEEPPAALRDAVARARSLGDVAKRSAELEAKLAKAARTGGRQLAALAPWAGDGPALERAAPPDRAAASGLARALATLAARRRELSQEHAQKAAARERARLREEQVVRDEDPVGPEHVAAARALRDEAWRAARSQILAPVATVDPSRLAGSFEERSREADRLADRRTEVAGAWAELVAARREREVLDLEIEQLERRLADVGGEHEEKLRAWSELVTGAGLPRLAPEELDAWIPKREAALEALEVRRQAEEDLGRHRAEVGEVARALRAALAPAAQPASGLEGASFDALLARAEDLVQSFEEARVRREGLERERQGAERDVREQTEKLRRAREGREGLEECERTWRAAMEEAALPAELHPSEARAVVETLQAIEGALAQAADLREKRIGAMQRDLDALHHEARALARSVAADLEDRAPESIASALGERLAEAKRLAETRRRAAAEAGDLEARLGAARKDLAEAAARLRPLLELAGVDAAEALAELIEASDRLRDLEAREEARAQELHRGGDGLALLDLEAEVRAADRETLAARLAQAEVGVGALAQRRQELAVDEEKKRDALAAIAGAAQAAAAAADKQQALATMEAAVERWIRLRTAARTLRWAIDRFRRKQQGPLLERAGAIFATLTLGEFGRLEVELDEKDTPQLVGVRASSDERVAIDGLSTGTADQLYLALRVAALEAHLEARPPLPFVADDLLVHFDDRRAAAGFRVLAELAKRTQVLFFTHHEHLVDVARAALGEVSLNVVQIDA